ncbi:MAG: phytanoyl-CoA dioxygenase family protein [Gammaproteobacteria bacterium]|nr:phytanoyl-CoA dioxygenase family protein [Gammaproteobacteria bacterium]
MNPDRAALLADHRLGVEEAQQYRAEGFLVRERAFDAAAISLLTAAVEAAAALALARTAGGDARSYVLDGKRFVDSGHVTVQFEPPPHDPAIKVIEPVCELHPALDALLDDPRLTAPIRDILGRDAIALWTNKLNLKRPGAGSGFGWHQDSPYWIHDCGHVDLLPNVMVVLDDASAANGCFKVIRGSHREGCLPGTDDGTQLGGFYTDPRRFDAARAVALEVPAGSLVFFDPHIVHGSGPNPSASPRRALIITYQPAGHPTLKSRRIRNIR